MKYGVVLALLGLFALPTHAEGIPTMAPAAPQGEPSVLAGGSQEVVPADATLVFGLTGEQLVAGVAIGVGLGAAAVAASGNTLAGASLGTLAAIYVAHLAVEAVVVGGMYYLWPSEEEPSDVPSRKMPIRLPGSTASPGLSLQPFHEASHCQAC
jgi:hypothetical protein